jgi:hypothetical protein
LTGHVPRTAELSAAGGTVNMSVTASVARREWPVVLVRRLIGDVLRRRRVDQGRTLREVSAAARVSLGYLSEVERGRKEASSELLAAICQALDLPMSEVLREVSEEMSRVEAAAVGALTQLRSPRRPAGRDMVAVG